MHIFYNSNHQLHHPVDEFYNLQRVPNPEIPDRLNNILTAVQAQPNHQLHSVDTVNPNSEASIRQALAAIHDQTYLEWLEQVQVEEALYPSVFNYQPTLMGRGATTIEWGNFVTDTFTPLLPQTWEVAFTATQVVSDAVAQLLIDGEPTFAMTRPPGHHAGRSRVGGYCFLNNAGVAAQLLSAHGKVAILDVDYHHGNGTQDVFYQRADVVTCSIHADPVRKFPYFLGTAAETGMGDGAGANLNLPLAAGITNQQYQATLETSCDWISHHQTDYLVISLGLDTHESDPIADFKLTTDYYAQMAATIAQLQIPTIVILEGGYSTSAIGHNVVSFLAGLE